MARLVVDSHPNRVFKDEWWDDWGSANGYRSIADLADIAVPLCDHHAFAVVLDDDAGDAESQLYEDIVHLRLPFVRAEVSRDHGGLTAIGFYKPE
jgi:hypothetical protein